MIKEVSFRERKSFDKLAAHPLQSWAWGEFRKQTGVAVERLGFYENGQLTQGLQTTFHPIPLLGKTAGYVPKGFAPNEDQLAALKTLGEQHHALFIKLEPDVSAPIETAKTQHQTLQKFLVDSGSRPGRPLFTPYTFKLDLTQSENQLFANLANKTRYNVRLAKKKGVEIFENTSPAGFDAYLKILRETTTRQGFYAHSPEYFQTMWQTLKDSGMMHIFNAVYQQMVLVSWIVFTFNGKLYYPYGASVREYREVMASNLMMWEVIRFGQKTGCTTFDMWGSLGPDPDQKNPWYGFHRFKEGYGGQLTEFVGTYDLVLQSGLYPLFRLGDDWRWKILRLRKKLGF